MKARVNVVRSPPLKVCGNVGGVSSEKAVPDVRVQEVKLNCEPAWPILPMVKVAVLTALIGVVGKVTLVAGFR